MLRAWLSSTAPLHCGRMTRASGTPSVGATSSARTDPPPRRGRRSRRARALCPRRRGVSPLPLPPALTANSPTTPGISSSTSRTSYVRSDPKTRRPTAPSHRPTPTAHPAPRRGHSVECPPRSSATARHHNGDGHPKPAGRPPAIAPPTAPRVNTVELRRQLRTSSAPQTEIPARPTPQPIAPTPHPPHLTKPPPIERNCPPPLENELRRPHP